MPAYLYHDPCHSPMKLREPMKTVKALVGDNVLKSERCCGESGTFGVTPARHRDPGALSQGRGAAQAARRRCARAARWPTGDDTVKILTSCPSCLQGLTRYEDDLQNGLLEGRLHRGRDGAPHAGRALAAKTTWRAPTRGGIERVLV